MRLTDYPLSKTEYSGDMSRFIVLGKIFFPTGKKRKRQEEIKVDLYLDGITWVICLTHHLHVALFWPISLPEIHPYFYPVDGLKIIHLWNYTLLFFSASKDKKHASSDKLQSQQKIPSQINTQYSTTDFPTNLLKVL